MTVFGKFSWRFILLPLWAFRDNVRLVKTDWRGLSSALGTFARSSFSLTHKGLDDTVADLTICFLEPLKSAEPFWWTFGVSNTVGGNESS